MAESMETNQAMLRCEQEAAFYREEIEQLKKQIKEERDESKMVHLKKLLRETQHALTHLLAKMEELREK